MIHQTMKFSQAENVFNQDLQTFKHRYDSIASVELSKDDMSVLWVGDTRDHWYKRIMRHNGKQVSIILFEN